MGREASFEPWERNELDNPFGGADWVYSSLTCELSISNLTATAEEEYPPWNEVKRVTVQSSFLIELYPSTTVHSLSLFDDKYHFTKISCIYW